MCTYLDGQVAEKKNMRQTEDEGNRMYMLEWNEKMENQFKLLSEKEQNRKQAIIAN